MSSPAPARKATPWLKFAHQAPPNSIEAEQGILGCLLLDPAKLADVAKIPYEYFYDLRHATIFTALREMWHAREVVDTITLSARLKKKKLLNECGGNTYLMQLPGMVPSAANLPYYLDIAREKYSLRKLVETCRGIHDRVYTHDGEANALLSSVVADLDLITRAGRDVSKDRPALRIWKASELLTYTPPPGLELVGDQEIFMGYEGVCVFAGPGSSGKSLCVAALALAGARGDGYWMGRKVHRKFKTLILQAENGKRRLKRQIERMAQNHPELDLENHIFFSEPPEGGLPFDSAKFRDDLREIVATLKPDLIILDPWSHVGCEDSADAIKDKLTQIRSCFPYGDECPGLIIIAHTKKPRPEDVRKGRGLMYMVSGSINLVNTSRCTYIMLPWSDDIEDQRVYFATPKLNDGENYPPTVWIRKFGTFFEHDPKTNPKDFGRDEDDERRKCTEEHLRSAFEGVTELASGALVKKLAKICGGGESTVWRAVGEDGYLRPLLMRSGHGKLKLKESEE